MASPRLHSAAGLEFQFPKIRTTHESRRPFSANHDMLIPVHPLTENWFSSSLSFILIFLAAYLGTHYVFWIADDDKDDQPRKYRELSLTKNIIVAVCNAVLSFMMVGSMYTLGYSLTCEPVPRGGWKTKPSLDDEIPIYMIFFLLIKILECLDSLIQIIREEPSGPWLLFHHATMVIIAWLGLRCVPGGTAAILASVNCICHAIVYAYLAITYFLTFAVPEFPSVINHGQFFTILYLCHTSIQRECGFPAFASGFIQVYVGGLIAGWHCFGQ